MRHLEPPPPRGGTSGACCLGKNATPVIEMHAVIGKFQVEQNEWLAAMIDLQNEAFRDGQTHALFGNYSQFD